MSLSAVFAFLAAGMVVGRQSWAPAGRFPPRLTTACLFGLLFFMGFTIGRTEEIGGQLSTIGLLSTLFTFATIGGTVLVVALYDALRPRAPRIGPGGEPPAVRRPAVSAAQLGEPLRLVSVFAAGFGTAALRWIPPGVRGEAVTTWLLYGLLFLVGFDLVRSKVNLAALLLRPRTLILPLLTAVGSLLGCALLAPLVGLPVAKAMAVGSGFGWYSLSGVLIADMGDAVLGSVAFISNIMRETVALLTIPLIARFDKHELAVRVAGATSMDVTLPLIERSCGAEAVPMAVASGGVLSFLVPFLVPFLYHL